MNAISGNYTRFFTSDFNPASYGTHPDFSQYRPLHRAILEGDWESTESFYRSHPEAVTNSITESFDTALMVGIMSGQKIEFITNQVEFGEVDLRRVNKEGNTALHEAAIVGHLKAAELLVGRDRCLLYIRNSDGYVPLHLAAAYGQREILFYFLRVGEVHNIQLSESELDMLMHLEITARFFDVRQPPKDFRQSYVVRKGLKKLLDLPLEQRKAPLLLNFIPTYTSKLADVPRKRKKSASPTTASTVQAASTSEEANQPSSSPPPVTEKKRRRRLVKAADMERPKTVVRDLLSNLPDDMDDAPTQQVPPPKPPRVKKAQSKAKTTKAPAEVDDTVPISQLAEKTIPAPAKRSAGTQPSASAPSKKQKSTSGKSTAGTTSSRKIPQIPWEPKITLEDRPIYANESAQDINVGVALSTAVLLEGDLEQNAQISEYENFCLMMQRSVQAIQHAHSFSVKAFETRSELVDLKREYSHIHKQNMALQIEMRKLDEQATAAITAKQIADEKADAAEALKNVAVSQQKEAEQRARQAEKKLEEALATKEADLKTADALAYQQGMDAVAEDYKLQVLKACNKGFVLGWNALSKELNLPADSPWRKTKAMRLPCPLPPSPTQTEEETESEAEAEDEVEDGALVRKSKEAIVAKSPPQGNEVMDLTAEENEEVEKVPKETGPSHLSSDLLLADRSVEETVAEIDAEIAVEKAAEEVQAEKVAEVVEPKDAEVVLPEPSEVSIQPPVEGV